MSIVPNVPGVPPIIRTAIAPLITLLTADTFLSFGTNLRPTWGIYKDGQPIIPADTAAAFNFRREWAVADYPIEQGGFKSYDKVDLPFEPRVTLVTGGQLENRQAFLSAIDRLAKTLDLVDVVTPEIVYSSVNIQHYDYRRTSRNGVGLLAVDVWLLEIRISGQSGQNVKDANAASQTSDGNVSTQPPTNQETGVLPSIT